MVEFLVLFIILVLISTFILVMGILIPTRSCDFGVFLTFNCSKNPFCIYEIRRQKSFTLINNIQRFLTSDLFGLLFNLMCGTRKKYEYLLTTVGDFSYFIERAIL